MAIPVGKQTLLSIGLGPAHAGAAATVQYRITKADGSLLQDWTNAGVFELGHGNYAAPYTFTVEGGYVLEGRETVSGVYTGPGTAQVSTDTDAMSAKIDLIGSGQLVVTTPVAASGAITIIHGDDYSNSDGRALVFTGSGWPDLTTASSVSLVIADELSVAGTVIDAATVRFELTAAQTGAIPADAYDYAIVAVIGGRTNTIGRGSATVRAAVPPPTP